MLKANRLKKCYKSICPLRNVNLHLEKGLKVIYGRNASGKTTLMETLSGILSPTDGIVEVEGSISFMPQEPMLYEEYRIRDYALLLHHMNADEVQYVKMVKRLEINMDTHAYSLSYGTKKAVFMAIVLSVNAENYLLDEPFLGIDINRRGILLNFLYRIANKKAILMTESEKILLPDWILDGGILVASEN